jgi:hypothetical protein
MARFDPLRAVAIDVVFRSLDRPHHIGLLNASGFQAHILRHFLDIVKIHMSPPKSLVKGDGVLSWVNRFYHTMASRDAVISSGAILLFMYGVCWFEDARHKRCTCIREAF